ncbi:MAG TPA: hypothetical protein VGS28_01880 [Candidatus Saccharimonadales bacterium]|nr:hypothetical protein [Candidatus Saccharimonadales bacterium]
MFRSTQKQKRLLRKYWPGYLEPFEESVYSQNGEDGIIAELLHRTGTESRFGVEFGVEDGVECNSRLLKESGWQILQMDGRDDNSPEIKKEFVTAENINRLFKKYSVPNDLDFLCIDIDSNDYWIWKSLSNSYRPRLVVTEYNASIPPWQAKTIKYDPKHYWDTTNYFGGSLLAMYHIAKSKGYSLVYCESRGVNAFFIRDDLLKKGLEAKDPNRAYRGPSYGQKNTAGDWIGHKQSGKAMIDTD